MTCASDTKVYELTRFDILFEKLEEAKEEQQLHLYIDYNEISEASKTASLFQEFQSDFIEAETSLFTRC